MAEESDADTSVVARAPGSLRLVQQFVNSRDIEADGDELSDAIVFARWCASLQTDLDIQEAARIAPADLARARELREDLRAALIANHDGGPLPERTATALTEATKRVGLRAVFTPSGLALEGEAGGVDALLAAVIGAVAAAISDGSWSRLKACRNDACQWAFYDRSRSRSGQWCSMGICGNRAKQAKWRAQHSGELRTGDAD